MPSNAAAHVACWRSMPAVPGRGGMCGVPAAHLARRMQQQLPHRARELSPRVAVAGCLSLCRRPRLLPNERAILGWAAEGAPVA